MQNTDILEFIDEFLTEHCGWLPNMTVDFALDVRSMVEATSDERVLEGAAA
jgi:hypothetical protein